MTMQAEIAATSHPNCSVELASWGLNSADANDATALMWASASAARHDAECISNLVNNGAFIQNDDVHGRSALHHAAWSGSDRAVGALLALGAEPDFLDYSGQSPLIFALRSPWNSTAKATTLIKAADVTSWGDGMLQSVLAHSSGDADVLQTLLLKLQAAGQAVDLACKAAPPAPCPLLIALQTRCEECVAVLLQFGADPVRSATGASPLLATAARLRLPQAQALLAQRTQAIEKACTVLEVPLEHWSDLCISWLETPAKLTAAALMRFGLEAEQTQQVLQVATKVFTPNFATRHMQVFGFIPPFSAAQLRYERKQAHP